MENNVGTSDLRTAVLPDLNSFSEHATELWRPEITDPELRKLMFQDPHLSAHLYDDVLAELGLANALPATLLPDAEDLLYLLNTDAKTVALRAGLVRCGHELARLVSTGKLDVTNSDWNVDDLRFALALRAHSIDEPQGGQEFATRVKDAGQNCMSAWLNALPEAVQRAIEVSDTALSVALRKLHSSGPDAEIFAACLSAMRASS